MIKRAYDKKKIQQPAREKNKKKMTIWTIHPITHTPMARPVL